MYKDHDTNGVIYTDGKECTYYELINYNLIEKDSSSIYLQSQFKNGGQSANRLARNRDIERETYITHLAEKAVDIFYDKENNRKKVKKLLFCGPAQFKIEMSQHKLIDNFFDIVTVVNMADIDLKKIIDVVNSIVDPAEKKHLANINRMINFADNKLVFGDEIKGALDDCMLETLYIHIGNNFLENLELNYSPNIVKISSDVILQYGGMIGIKYY